MLILAEYFQRIGFPGDPSADLDTLNRLHYSHPLAIPFENLSTVIREPVPIDIDSVARKLIASGRGGYCFEQNTLFQAVLDQIGFRVTPLAARVVWNEDHKEINPRTHMVLLAEVEGRNWLCDVGFGGVTLTQSLLFEPDVEQDTAHETFRFVAAGREHELQVRWAGRWRPMYRFDLQPQLPIDYAALNHYVATHPNSHFRTTLLAGRAVTDGRYSLVNNRFSVYRNGIEVEQRTLGDVKELKSLLQDSFGINVPTNPSLEPALNSLFERQRGQV
jgi:N-hydroxyarylamine O-acetyltransferase